MLKYYVTYSKPTDVIVGRLPTSEHVCNSKEELEQFIKESAEKDPRYVAYETAVGRPRSGYQPCREIHRIIVGEEMEYQLKVQKVEVLVPQTITTKEWKL